MLPIANTSAPAPQLAEARTHKPRIDPILQEVYDLKARLNKEADYSVRNILERVKQSAKPVVG